MTETPAPTPAPAAATHVWPAFTTRDAQAEIAFLVGLGFVATAVYTDDDGRVAHAQIDWPEGGGVMLGDAAGSGALKQAPGGSAVYVVTADVDAAHARAVALGATITRQPSAPDYGGREFGLRDPEGNDWSFGTYPGEPPAS